MLIGIYRLIEVMRPARVRRIVSSRVFTAIDADRFDEVSELEWHVELTWYGTMYAVCRRLYLHKLITGPVEKGLHVDHRNGYTMDNRRCNLRAVPPGDNGRNQHPFTYLPDFENLPMRSPFAPPTGPFLETGQTLTNTQKTYAQWSSKEDRDALLRRLLG